MELLIRNHEVEELARRILQGYATEEDLRAAKIEDVKAIKTDTGELHRQFSGSLDRVKTEESRTKRYIASNETVDRMGDIIRVSGWQLERFKENPQALWAHDGRQLPIGLVTEMSKGTRNGSPALIETIKYLDEGTTAAADLIWKLVDQGVVRAVSVGFIPVKVIWVDDPEERKKLGLGPYGCVYEKQEQLELSNCTIPANPDALSTKFVRDALRAMVKSGQVSERDAEAVIDLGEHKTIQVPVPELPESTTGTTVTSTDWVFRVGEDGILRQVKAGEPAPEADADQADLEARIEDLQLNVLSAFGELSSQLSAIAKRIESIVPELEAAMGRALNSPERQKTRLLEDAITRVGRRLAQESL